MDKTKGGQDQGWGMGMAGGGGKWKQLYLNNNKNKGKKGNVFNITNHNGDAIKAMLRYNFISIWIVTMRKQKISIDEDVNKLEFLCPVGRIIKWCSPYDKQYGDSSKH